MRHANPFALSAFLIALPLATFPVLAQSPVDKINAEAALATITVQPLRDHLSAVMGSGGNITLLDGADGKFLVDAGIAVSRPRVESAIAGISPEPLRYVVNTHWHWDHTDGNAWMHGAGATIIAHKKTLEHLSQTTRVADWDHTFAPVPPEARPTIILTGAKTMRFDAETVEIRPFERAHTDGDLSVYFGKADVLATGDTFWNGYYPFIDYVAGGGIDGMISAANTNIAMTTDKTIIVPGHGPVGDRTQLIAFRDMLVAIRAKVAAMKTHGMTLREIIAAKPTAAFDAKWGQFVIDPAFFTKLVYRGIPSSRRTSKTAQR